MVCLSTDNTRLPYKSVSLTEDICVSEKKISCRQYVSVTVSLCLSQSVCVCHRQYVSLTDSLFLPQKVYVRQSQSMSVTHTCCLSQKTFACQRKKQVCFRHYVSVTDSLCLSETVCFCCSDPCVCQKQVVHVTKNSLSVSLCLYQTLLLIICGIIFTF